MDTTELGRELREAAGWLVARTGDLDLTLLTARAHVSGETVQVQAVCRANARGADVVLTSETDGSVSVLVERDGGGERVKRGTIMADVYAAAWGAA